MELRINFSYSVTYIPYRHQNARTGYLESYTDVELAELTRKNVDTAFRVRSHELSRFANTDADDMSTKEVLAWDGRFWLETCTVDELAAKLEGNEFGSKTHFDACKFHSDHRRVTTEAMIMEENRLGLREYNNDGGEKVRNSLARRAEDIIIVDGKVYVREMEPCWRIQKDGRVQASALPYEKGEPFQDVYDDYWARHHFDRWSADRVEAATSQSADPAADLGAELVEVIDAQYVRYSGRLLPDAGSSGQNSRRSRRLPSRNPSGTRRRLLRSERYLHQDERRLWSGHGRDDCRYP